MAENCPDCESPHDTNMGVVQHMVMSNDHEYETREEAWQEILRNESPEGTTTDTPKESNAESNVTEGNESGQSSANPVVDGPDANPRTNGDSGGDSEEKECPQCEGALYDFSGLSSGSYHEVNGQQVFVRGDFQCADCGQWWVDE